MTKLDYYFRTNSYEIDHILSKGLFFDYYKENGKYGKGIYLTYNNIGLWNKNPISLQVKLKNLNNILNVVNFEELITDFLNHIDITANSNVNVAEAPNEINSIILQKGDLISLTQQNNIQQNGVYMFIEAGKPLLEYGNITNYIIKFGTDHKFGNKYVMPYIINNGYNGIKISSENFLILYNGNNLNKISVI